MGECSATCGFGTRIASRECLQGECAEELIREFPCVGPCPLYGEWTESSCSVNCGSGTKFARRECLAGICEDEDLLKEVYCEEAACPLYSNWTIGSCGALCLDKSRHEEVLERTLQ